MHTTASGHTIGELSTLDIRVNSPDSEPLGSADLWRLFPGAALTEARLDRLCQWPRISVCCGARIVAVATCQKTDTEMRAADIGFDQSCGCSLRAILDALVDALELAGLAGGCRRLVLLPPSRAVPYLERRGFTTISERCAGAWLEKILV